MSEFKPYLAYSASAGSGKTFALSVRYISLLFLGADPSKILTLTFTNKAAAEMKSRITATLQDLANRPEKIEIAKQVGLSEKELLAKQPAVLHRFLQEDLAISTIDAFFTNILRKFAFQVGLMPDFSIDQEVLDAQIITSFVRTCIQLRKYEELIDFSVQEKRKLSDMFTLLEGFFTKESELHLDTWKKAEYIGEQKLLQTLKVLHDAFEKAGANENVLKTLKAQSATELAERKYWKHESIEYWQYKKFVTDEIRTIFGYLQKDFLEYLTALERYILGELAVLYQAYRHSMRKLNKEQSILRFNDITNTLYRLLTDEVQQDFLYFRLDGKVEHLLVDEFQDTSIIQYAILRPIIEELSSGIGTKDFRTVFFVGDVKQSIYRFRGGAKELFVHACKEFSIDIENLDTNYRSSKNLVEYVNRVFAQKIQGYFPQKVKNSDTLGYVCVIQSDTVVKSVCEQVGELLGKGVLQSDIAVLVHQNKDALTIKDALLHEKIVQNIQTEASLKLIHVPLIAGILDALRYAYFKDALYGKHFLSILGKAWEEELDLSFLDLQSNPVDIIYNLVEQFELFALDMDIVKLLELAKGYEDIESFLFASESFTAEAKQEDNDGVRVLTIHKSKGLEFEHVIVCDRLSRPKGGGGSFIYEYDGVHLLSVYKRMQNRQYVDKAYARALEKEQRLSYEDMLNMYYVAFTRAESSLIICAKEKSSAFEFLDLQTCQYGSIEAKKSQKSKKEFLKSMELQPKHHGRQKELLPDSSSKDHSDPLAIHYGLAVHYCLELLASFELTSLDEAFEVMCNRYANILSEEHLQSIKKRVTLLLCDESFQDIVKNGKIFKEQPIAYDGERKQIDLLIQKDENIIVVDYKSSNSVYESHLQQVALYKKALQKIYDKPVLARVCYIRQEQIEIINL